MQFKLGGLTGEWTATARSLAVVAAMICGASATSACSRDLSPTAPTDVATVVIPPPPVESNVTLKGRVTESAPTTVMGVWDATVTLSDGTGSWNSEKTVGGAGQGVYSIASLKPGRYEAVVTAGGFVSARRAITLPADAATDFPLLPVAQTVNDKFEYQISDVDGTCSDGAQQRPCRIVAIPIHNAGPIDATLTWKAATTVGLNVCLFEKGQAEPLARATPNASGGQTLVANIPGGALYELRITYASGTGQASYTLRVAHPN